MWLLPVPLGPSSARLKLFSTSGTVRASKCHFTRSAKFVGSISVERSRASIHCPSVNARRPWVDNHFHALLLDASFGVPQHEAVRSFLVGLPLLQDEVDP